MTKIKTVLRLLLRTNLFAGGALVMHAEGASQSQPGIGFVAAMALIVLSLAPWRYR